MSITEGLGLAPRVFLSSTILDLADLRSATRYYLEQYGFEVFASEFADFPHGLDDETRVAALAPLDDADVYLLIVGFRYGKSGSDGISATRLEFRKARELHRLRGRPKPLYVIRHDVLLHQRAGSAPPGADDWESLTSFIDEVHDSGPHGDPNWVNSFASFADLVAVLQAHLRTTGSLRRKALEANLVEELLANCEALLMRLRGAVGARSRLMGGLDGLLTERAEQVDLSQENRRDLLIGRLMLPPRGAFQVSALDEAISSGQFLDWDIATTSWMVGPTQRMLIEMRDRIRRYDLVSAMLDTPAYMREHAQISGRRPQSRTVSGDYLSVALGVRDQLVNVEAQIVALLGHLMPPGGPLVEAPSRPPSPIPGESERIQAETVTRLDVLNWLKGFAHPDNAVKTTG